ncbi:MAG: DUF2905 domain-containing protein [Ignavibacteriales bacterium CG07_land_8_20_14_0_80_59_12]|jgi:hypothetical protein|nr:MAG: DUF2905 domain-containing protein [Ignavibacteriales bacterium CG07_land_8_20_14_0_80_59_12]
MQQLGKFLILTGGLVALCGVLLMIGPNFPIIGKLPGDIHVKRENVQICFPITTSILLSVILSLLLWAISKLFHR